MRWAGELTRRERRAAHATLAPALLGQKGIF